MTDPHRPAPEPDDESIAPPSAKKEEKDKIHDEKANNALHKKENTPLLPDAAQSTPKTGKC